MGATNTMQHNEITTKVYIYMKLNVKIKLKGAIITKERKKRKSFCSQNEELKFGSQLQGSSVSTFTSGSSVFSPTCHCISETWHSGQQIK